MPRRACNQKLGYCLRLGLCSM